MKRYCILDDTGTLATRDTFSSRAEAMRAATQHTDLPWHELQEVGYRICCIVPRLPIPRKLVSLAIELPDEQLMRLESLAIQSGMSVRHLASVLIGGGLAQSARINDGH